MIGNFEGEMIGIKVVFKKIIKNKNYQLIIWRKCVIMFMGDVNDSYTNYQFIS